MAVVVRWMNVSTLAGAEQEIREAIPREYTYQRAVMSLGVGELWNGRNSWGNGERGVRAAL